MSFRRAHIRYVLPLAIALATAGAFYLVFRRTGACVVHVAARPNWFLLAAAFVVWAGVQPLRAWAWSSTLRAPALASKGMPFDTAMDQWQAGMRRLA